MPMVDGGRKEGGREGAVAAALRNESMPKK